MEYDNLVGFDNYYYLILFQFQFKLNAFNVFFKK